MFDSGGEASIISIMTRNPQITSLKIASAPFGNQIVDSKVKIVKFIVETPANAEIELPDGRVHQVVAGTYQYECVI